MYAHLDNQQIKVFKRKHGHIGVFLNPLHKRRDVIPLYKGNEVKEKENRNY